MSNAAWNEEVRLKIYLSWTVATVHANSDLFETYPAALRVLISQGLSSTIVLYSASFAVKVTNKSQHVYEDQLVNFFLEHRILDEAGSHPYKVEWYS